jgi:hypothetical protein
LLRYEAPRNINVIFWKTAGLLSILLRADFRMGIVMACSLRYS